MSPQSEGEIESAVDEVRPPDLQKGGKIESGPAAGKAIVGAKRAHRDYLRRLSVPIAWITIIVIFGILRPDVFLTFSNISAVLASQSVLIIVALALTLALTTGVFDLSIASISGLTAMIVAYLNVKLEWPVLAAVVVAILVGAGLGWLNGFLVVRLKIFSLIATLATGTVLGGLTLLLSGQETIGIVSRSLTGFINDSLFGIQIQFYIALLLTIMVWYLLDFLPLGRRMLATGVNSEVARLNGIEVGRLQWLALIASGTVSAIGGVVYVGLIGSANPSSSASFLLPAFAVVFLGSTAIAPGRFNAWGTLIAALFLATGFTGLQLMGFASWIQSVFYGLALVIAVAISQAMSGAYKKGAST